MSNRFDLVVFDWDGTLMDSTASIASAIRSACADLGLAVPSVEQARHVIGMGLAEALRYAVPELGEADYPRLAERYRFHYLARDQELVLFDGVEDLLHELRGRGLLLAVATGKSRRGLDRVLAQTGLAPLFDATRCADECFSKPHPAMLLELMDELGVEPERTLMIGDTTHDLLMAANAGTPALGLSCGAHPVDQLEGAEPLAVLDSAEGLRRWLIANA
ncbi:HAD-IA family hydrolase [Niveibacterium terrae]|uniref:HAD-IA family hydrolase n=1 Tax=Niveibacterium terrae TaxID=3373598 RepID=UPI003A917947